MDENIKILVTYFLNMLEHDLKNLKELYKWLDGTGPGSQSCLITDPIRNMIKNKEKIRKELVESFPHMIDEWTVEK